MLLPQFGIFAQGTAAHRFLEFRIDATLGSDRVANAFASLREPAVTAGGVNLVLVSRPRYGESWRRLTPLNRCMSFGMSLVQMAVKRPRPSTTPGCGSVARPTMSSSSMPEPPPPI